MKTSVALLGLSLLNAQAFLLSPSSHALQLRSIVPRVSGLNGWRRPASQARSVVMAAKKPSLGPGLFDPMIQLGPEDPEEAEKAKESAAMSMQQLAELWAAKDADDNGLLNLLELRSLVGDIGTKWSVEQARSVLWTLDSDKDGLVSFGEFHEWYSQGSIHDEIIQDTLPDIPSFTAMSKEEVENIFQLYDENGNGKFELNEFRDLILGIGVKWSDDKLQVVMDRLGSQSEGTITFTEFYAWFMSGHDFLGEQLSSSETQVIVEPNSDDVRRIFVRGFPWKATEITAQRYFSQVGEVDEVQMINWSRDGTPSGRCIVTFKEASSVDLAMSRHRTRMGKRWLEVYRVNEGDREEVHKVDKAHHGALIGVKGAKVQEMQRESGARIFFESSPEAVMVIKGREAERKKAWAMAQEVIKGNQMEIHSVDKALHGRLIGAKGVIKKAIESESGAHILYRDDPADQCVIFGTDSARARAWQLIQGKMWEFQHASEVRYELDKKFHGTLIGKDSMVIKALQEASGARIKLTSLDVEIDGKPMKKGMIVLRGTEEQCTRGWEMSQVILRELPALLSDLRNDEDIALGALRFLPLSPKEQWKEAVREVMEIAKKEVGTDNKSPRADSEGGAGSEDPMMLL